MVKGKIRVGHSPDADDAFMFYAIDKGLVDTHGLTVSHVVEEIQSLNERAMRGELEVTAVSTYAFFQMTNKYSLMTCGASIGDNYGPVIVSKTMKYPKEIKGKRIAVPGKWTTAFLTPLCWICPRVSKGSPRLRWGTITRSRFLSRLRR